MLLQQLPTVGDVTVVRDSAPAGYSRGFIWTITFETQVGNLQSLSVDGNTTALPLVGQDVLLDVLEVRGGVHPSLQVDVNGLESGARYFARASATNSAGTGPTTLSLTQDRGALGGNNDGLGVAPLAVVAGSAPAAPVIADVSVVSASQLEVKLMPSDDHSGHHHPQGYKVCLASSSRAHDGQQC